MRYVALLRGINVGGNNKIAMPKLIKTFERIGCSNVTTYINSGNVFFDSEKNALSCSATLREAIKNDFSLTVPVLIRNMDQIKTTLLALPEEWQNNAATKCDVLFLGDSVDSPSIVDELHLLKGVDEVIYTPGALLWRIDRALYGKSGMSKLAGTPFYKQVTVRNCNTLRKIAERL